MYVSLKIYYAQLQVPICFRLVVSIFYQKNTYTAILKLFTTEDKFKLKYNCNILQRIFLALSITVTAQLILISEIISVKFIDSLILCGKN